MFIDSHTHLDHCREGTAGLLEQARSSGVELVVQSGTDPSSSQEAVSMADTFPEVFATVGYHPHDAGKLDEEGWRVLEDLVQRPRVLAVGETGLDFYRDHSPRAAQEEAFRRHLGLAREAGLPVVVHSRGAEEETFVILGEEAHGLTVLFHCFSAPGRWEEVVAAGYYVSFAGNVTFNKAKDLQEAARRMPADRLLVETDAPYLAPEPFRGRPNTPAKVVETYRFLAGLRGVQVEDLAAQVRENMLQVFPRLAF